MPNRRPSLSVALRPLAVALCLALAFQAIIAARSPVIAKDGITFIRMAKRLQSDFVGTCRMEDQHPGYPALLLAGSHLARLWPNLGEFDLWIVGGRVASGVCGLLAIVFLWLFARRLYNQQIADVAALLAAVWPLLRQNASDVLSDTPHLMFYLAAAWLTCEGLVRGRALWYAAAGVASGLAFWVRPEGLLVSLCAFPVMVVLQWRRQGRTTSTVAESRRAGIPTVPLQSPEFSRIPLHSSAGSKSSPAAWRRTAALADTAALVSAAALVGATLLVAAPYALTAGKFTSKFANKQTFFKGPTASASTATHANPVTQTNPQRKQGSEVAEASPATHTNPQRKQGVEAIPAAIEPSPLALKLPLWAWQLPETGLLSEPAPGGTLPDERARPRSKLGVLANALLELGQELAQGFYYLLLIPLAAGRFAPGRRPWQDAPAAMTTVLWFGHAGLLLVLYYVAGYISHRHVIPLVALLLPMTGVGLVWIAERLDVIWSAVIHRRLRVISIWSAARSAARVPRRRFRLISHWSAGIPLAGRFWDRVSTSGLARPRIASAAVAFVVFAGLLPKTIGSPHRAYGPIASAAHWVRAHARPGDSVLSTSSYVRFYAGLTGAVLGSEAENLRSGIAVAPDNGHWTFLVLEVNDKLLDRERLNLLDAAYEPVLDLAAHPRKTWLRVLVYRAIPDANAQLANRPAAPR